MSATTDPLKGRAAMRIDWRCKAEAGNREPGFFQAFRFQALRNFAAAALATGNDAFHHRIIA